MGRNAAIKRFDATPEGSGDDLFGSAHGRLPVVLALLESPWIVRASELARSDDEASGRRIDEVISVVWDSREHRPAAFEWRTRIYRIDMVVQSWAIERRWWEPGMRVSRRCWRVVSRGGTYDIAFDRSSKVWRLLSVVD